jgi:hypothetical protein
MQKHKELAALFATGFIQVFFVVMNTYIISKEMIVAVFFATFLINIIWSYNVKKVVFGTLTDRLIYALGAAFGGTAGLGICLFILNVK